MTPQEKAIELHRQGYNCAQSVLITLAPDLGLDPQLAARITAALGAGVGGRREICGAANAMSMAVGMLHSHEASQKVPAMQKAGKLLDAFAAANNGCMACRDLKGKPGAKTCDQLIAECVTLFTEANS